MKAEPIPSARGVTRTLCGTPFTTTRRQPTWPGAMAPEEPVTGPLECVTHMATQAKGLVAPARTSLLGPPCRQQVRQQVHCPVGRSRRMGLPALPK